MSIFQERIFSLANESAIYKATHYFQVGCFQEDDLTTPFILWSAKPWFALLTNSNEFSVAFHTQLKNIFQGLILLLFSSFNFLFLCICFCFVFFSIKLNIPICSFFFSFFFFFSCLTGLVVKASAYRAEDPGSCLTGLVVKASAYRARDPGSIPSFTVGIFAGGVTPEI